MSVPPGYKFRGYGKKYTATKTTTTNLDFKMVGEREIDKIDILLSDQHEDDTLRFQVVDIDNVLGYGANVVLDEFATDWQVDDTKKDQGEPFGAGYPATIPKDTYVRIIYDSKGTTTNVTVRVNYFLHEPPA